LVTFGIDQLGWSMFLSCYRQWSVSKSELSKVSERTFNPVL